MRGVFKRRNELKPDESETLVCFKGLVRHYVRGRVLRTEKGFRERQLTHSNSLFLPLEFVLNEQKVLDKS